MIAAIIACGVVVAWLLMLVALSGDNRVVIPHTVRIAEAMVRAARVAAAAFHDLALAFAKLSPIVKRMNDELERSRRQW